MMLMMIVMVLTSPNGEVQEEGEEEHGRKREALKEKDFDQIISRSS